MRTMSGSLCLHYDCSNRNSFGYCKTPVCINVHYQREQWGLPSTTNKSESVVIKQQTNADRIRAMSDAEKADFLCDIGECDRRCPAKIGDCIFSDSNCRSAWLDWLEQESEV